MITASEAYTRSTNSDTVKLDRAIMKAADDGYFDVNVPDLSAKQLSALKLNGYSVSQRTDGSFNITWW